MPVIKNLTRKSSGPVIKYILRYMLDDKKRLNKENRQFIIRHNIKSRSVESYIKEFKENETRRIYKRKNQIGVNHTIISWNSKDAEKITDRKLKAIAKEFIRLRGENNLYIISKHTDRKHIHLHCAVSSNTLAGNSSRQSKAQFASLKVDLQKFQIQHFPELNNSIPKHCKQKELGLKQYWKDQRAPQKEILQKAIEAALQRSKSSDDFIATLKEQGYEPYYRGQEKKLTGVKFRGGRKFRFKSLGVDIEKMTVPDIGKQIEEKQLAEINNIRNRSKSIERDKEDIGERDFEIQNNHSEQGDSQPMYLPLAMEGFGAFPTRCMLQEE